MVFIGFSGIILSFIDFFQIILKLFVSIGYKFFFKTPN